MSKYSGSIYAEDIYYNVLEDVLNESNKISNKKHLNPLMLEDDNTIINTQLAIAGITALLSAGKAFSRTALAKKINAKISIAIEKVSGNIFGRIKVDIKNNEFIIRGINYDKLIIRIRELYKERNIDSLFERKYKWLDEILYKRKKIKRKSDMTIVDLHVPLFFALEVATMFNELYEEFGFSYYLKIVKKLYKYTWLKDLVSNVSEPIDTKPLSSLRYTLKDYQKEFVVNYNTLKARGNLQGFILSFDQGLGKTLTSIALAECLHKDRVYIVCPNSLKENWSNELKQYFTKYEDEKLYKNEVYIVDHPKYKFTKDTKYIICNQEAIEKMLPYAKKGNVMIVVDEMHNFRNMNGKRVTDLLKLKDKLECEDNLLMSGTPIKATPNEIIPALLMIDNTFDLKSAKIYNRIFNIDDVSTAGIVQERFGRFIYRKTKKQVLSLPDKNQSSLYYTIKNSDKFVLESVNETVRERYNEMYEVSIQENDSLKRKYIQMVNKYSTASFIENKKYLSWLDNNVNTNVRAKDQHELNRQFLDEFASIHIKPNIKNDSELKEFTSLFNSFIQMRKSVMGKALGEILPKYRSEMYIALYEENKSAIIDMIKKHPKKTVIFSMMLDVVKYISKDLEKQGIGNVSIVGGVKDRMSIINDFKERDDIEVLVATSQTLSTGVTLTEASQMFFFGTPWRSADYEQACDRIHRIGQTSDVFIYDVLLDTPEKNLSTRMQDILKWSNKMFGSMIDNKEEE